MCRSFRAVARYSIGEEVRLARHSEHRIAASDSTPLRCDSGIIPLSALRPDPRRHTDCGSSYSAPGLPPPMLLNELQKQQKQIDEDRRLIRALEERVADLYDQVRKP